MKSVAKVGGSDNVSSFPILSFLKVGICGGAVDNKRNNHNAERHFKNNNY